ncbi:MAG: polyribonucleotide nucleotidyltransferase [Psittacicella sp.]
MTPFVKQFKYGKHTITLETGVIARQATAAIIASMDDTSVLVSIVAKKDLKENQDFFPLVINYQEKAYAAGKIPGGFFKREGKPSENETLIARLIDRPIRPLFPNNFYHEVQVVVTVLSANPNIPIDIISLIGTSAALCISGLPFNGPIAAARVGLIDNKLVLNPTLLDQKESKLDLVVSGTQSAVLMVESEASILSEEQMLEAVLFGHKEQQVVIDNILEFKKEINKAPWDWIKEELNQKHIDFMTNLTSKDIASAYKITDKVKRYADLDSIRSGAYKKAQEEFQEEFNQNKFSQIIHDIEYNVVRQSILAGNPRIDGRDTTTIRALDVCVGLLPRTHGSALFTRGETQSIGVVTLGNEKDAQIIDGILGDSTDPFLFHYNFPPYSVGETGMIGSPKRREIGHGRLAKRGLKAVVPTLKEFPYVIRVVSEITESNGSSSMASVCSASLSLMDAGVPLKAPVAGIAMGLVKEGDNFVILSDILGDEDHLGDMDFKVAGTEEGVTALQMDIKIDGITPEIMQKALNQAKAARLHILNIMNKAISEPRKELSSFVPKIYTIQIDSKKIKDVIGKGGSVVKSFTAENDASIDIDNKGLVKILTSDPEVAKDIIGKIQNIVQDPEIGKIYSGKITKLTDFGVFVAFLGVKEGLVHISQISNERITSIGDILQPGQEVNVKVIEIDKQGRVRLSIKDAVENLAQ